MCLRRSRGRCRRYLCGLCWSERWPTCAKWGNVKEADVGVVGSNGEPLVQGREGRASAIELKEAEECAGADIVELRTLFWTKLGDAVQDDCSRSHPCFLFQLAGIGNRKDTNGVDLKEGTAAQLTLSSWRQPHWERRTSR